MTLLVWSIGCVVILLRSRLRVWRLHRELRRLTRARVQRLIAGRL